MTDSVTMLTCPVCGLAKPLTADNWYRRGDDWLRVRCKSCRIAQRSEASARRAASPSRTAREPRSPRKRPETRPAPDKPSTGAVAPSDIGAVLAGGHLVVYVVADAPPVWLPMTDHQLALLWEAAQKIVADTPPPTEVTDAEAARDAAAVVAAADASALDDADFVDLHDLVAESAADVLDDDEDVVYVTIPVLTALPSDLAHDTSEVPVEECGAGPSPLAGASCALAEGHRGYHRAARESWA